MEKTQPSLADFSMLTLANWWRGAEIGEGIGRSRRDLRISEPRGVKFETHSTSAATPREGGVTNCHVYGGCPVRRGCLRVFRGGMRQAGGEERK